MGFAEKSGIPGRSEFGIVLAVFATIFVVGIPLGTIGGAFVWGGAEHLALKLLGVKTRGFEATLRARCYSHAPMVLGIVPICGAYAYPVYQLVCRIFGYKGVHRTTGARASLAVLLPVGLWFGGVMAIYLVVIFATIARWA